MFEGAGRFTEYAGGYQDWERYQRPVAAAPPVTKAPTRAPGREARRTGEEHGGSSTAGPKLSYREQRELEQLPPRIEQLESEQADLHARMGQGDFYRQPSETITAAMERLEAIRVEETESKGPAIVQELLFKAARARIGIAEVPIEFRNRAAGQSTLTLRTLLQGYTTVLKLRWKAMAGKL